MLAVGARLNVTVSLTERDGVTPPSLAELRVAFDRNGLELTAYRPATPDETAAAATTWARKLGVGAHRPATRIEAVRRMLDSRP